MKYFLLVHNSAREIKSVLGHNYILGCCQAAFSSFVLLVSVNKGMAGFSFLPALTALQGGLLCSLSKASFKNLRVNDEYFTSV